MPTVDEKPFSGCMKAIQVQLTLSDDCLNEAHGRFGLKSFVSAPGVKIQDLRLLQQHARTTKSRNMLLPTKPGTQGVYSGHIWTRMQSSLLRFVEIVVQEIQPHHGCLGGLMEAPEKRK